MHLRVHVTELLGLVQHPHLGLVTLPRFYRHLHKWENDEIGGAACQQQRDVGIPRTFKPEAVRLVRESAHPVAQVARDLGISDNVLYRWTRPAPAGRRPRAPHGSPSAPRRRNSRVLKRELARVTQERDFLKRAAAFFARESQ